MVDFDGWMKVVNVASAPLNPAPLIVTEVKSVLGLGGSDGQPSEAETDAARDRSREEQVLSGERAQLGKDFTYDPAALAGVDDGILGMSHQDIWDRVQGGNSIKGMDPAAINGFANAWRQISAQGHDAIDQFEKSISRAIADKWTGESGTAAAEATARYSTQFRKLPDSTQLLANGLDSTEAVLTQTKASVPEPKNLSIPEKITDWVPAPGVWRAAHHEQQEAEDAARTVVTKTYRPGVIEVDGRTPQLPGPVNPITHPGLIPGRPDVDIDGPDRNRPIVEPPSRPDDKRPVGPTDIGPHDTTPPSTTPDQGNPQSPSSPAVPAPTAPASTNPDTPKLPTAPAGVGDLGQNSKPWMQDPLARPSAAGLGSGDPSGGAGMVGTGAGGRPGGSLSPSNVRGGASAGGNAGGAAAAAGRGGAAGRAGAPGPGGMAPGAGRGKGDDDKEHKSADYLVNVDNGNELIGKMPKVAPPVIGG